MKIETLSIHAGGAIDPVTGAVSPPIHLSSTFERQPDGTYPGGYHYGRQNNPNRGALEGALSALEGGTAAAAVSSGSMAMMIVLQALSPADHVIAPHDIYYGIRRIIKEIFVPWGLEATFVDMSDMEALQGAVQDNTRLIIVESPSNPLLKITDIEAAAAIAHANGAALVCDNTIATPVLQRPLELGADFVVHASTKYLNGHSDVIGGIVITREENELFNRIRLLQTVGGAIPSPFDCWLTLRGIQTLPYRVKAASKNAIAIAQFLESHPNVEKVFYPGLNSHPGQQLAKKQMSAFGALMSVLLRSESEALSTAANAKLFTRATSFGGPHSFIEHRASMEGPETRTPGSLLRLSIGLEDVDDLIADLEQALRAA